MASKVKEEFIGKEVVTLKGKGRKAVQKVHFLTSGMTQTAINTAVTDGVALSHFEGDEKDMENLKRFVSRSNDTARRMRSVKKYKIALDTSRMPKGATVAAKPAKVSAEDKVKDLKFKLAFEEGMTTEQVDTLFSTAEKDLKQYQDVLSKVLGLSKWSAKKAYTALHPA